MATADTRGRRAAWQGPARHDGCAHVL